MKKLILLSLLAVITQLTSGQSVDGTLKTVTVSGTNTYSFSSSFPSASSYVTGEKWLVKFTNGNTDQSTLNRNSIGAKAIIKGGNSQILPGEITSGQVLLLMYDGIQFQIIGGSGDTNVSSRVFTTSIYGAIDDADISLGSSTFGTDNYAILQALLDEALDGPILVIWDGHYGISSSLNIHSNTTIMGLNGCGAILQPGSNARLIFTNFNRVTPSSVGGYGSNIVDHDITIENVVTNGNNVNNTGATRYPCIGFMGARRVLVKNCQALASNVFGMNATNVEYMTFDGCYINPGLTPPSTNYDGIHVDGYAKWVTIKNCNSENATDDNFVFMAEESSVSTGPISNCVMLNNTVHGGTLGIRIAVGTTGKDLTNISIDGLYGDTHDAAILIANWTASGAATSNPGGILTNLNVSNVNVTLSSSGSLFRFRAGNYYNCNFTNINLNSASTGANFMSLNDAGLSLQRLNISNVALDFSAMNTSPMIDLTGGSVTFLNIINFSFRQTGSSPTKGFIELASGTTLSFLKVSNALIGAVKYLVKANTGSTLNRVSISNTDVSGETSLIYSDIAMVYTFLSNSNPATSGLVFSGSGSPGIIRGSIMDWDTITPAALSANTDNYAPTGISNSKVLKISASGAYNLTGINAGTSMVDKRELILINVGTTNTITLKTDVTSTAANRFLLNADFALAPNEAVKLIYDGTAARWRKTY